ncbi:MAG: hypothetical protein QM528_06995 [Phycisphaerales bacterium]|nr:hypothetical protein [Phycisphaerales bacterium]
MYRYLIYFCSVLFLYISCQKNTANAEAPLTVTAEIITPVISISKPDTGQFMITVTKNYPTFATYTYTVPLGDTLFDYDQLTTFYPNQKITLSTGVAENVTTFSLGLITKAVTPSNRVVKVTVVDALSNNTASTSVEFTITP